MSFVVCEYANQVPPLVPHIILRLGQLWADLRCHWPLRSVIGVQLPLFFGPRRFHCSASQTLHLEERVQGSITSHGFPVVVLPCWSQLRFTHLCEQGTLYERPRVFCPSGQFLVWVLSVCTLRHLMSHFTARSFTD